MRIEKRLFTVNEIATYLGFSVSTIRKWIRTGQIPFCRVNGGIRFDIQEVEKWVTKNKRSICHV